VAHGLAAVQVDGRGVEDEAAVRPWPAQRCAQDGLQPRQQLARLERLGQVVVGAQLEARRRGPSPRRAR
jgi:hypothetical protein